jgi:hypothetical protein
MTEQRLTEQLELVLEPIFEADFHPCSYALEVFEEPVHVLARCEEHDGREEADDQMPPPHPRRRSPAATDCHDIHRAIPAHCSTPSANS